MAVHHRIVPESAPDRFAGRPHRALRPRIVRGLALPSGGLRDAITHGARPRARNPRPRDASRERRRMERDHRLVAGAKTGRRPRRAIRSGAATLLLALLLAAPGTAFSGSGDEVAVPAATPDPDKLPIIVHLLAGEEEGSGDSIAAVTSRVTERLEVEMSKEDLASVRTFTFFPAIALSADRDLIFMLLSMPEVISIERDHEVQALGDTALELELPPVSMPAPSESESTLDLQEHDLDLQLE